MGKGKNYLKYNRYLNRVVDDLFNEATKQKLTWKDFAKKSGLAPSTVYNLGNRITKFPQLRTVYLLAEAIGINLPSVKIIKKKYKKAG